MMVQTKITCIPQPLKVLGRFQAFRKLLHGPKLTSMDVATKQENITKCIHLLFECIINRNKISVLKLFVLVEKLQKHILIYVKLLNEKL